MKNLYDQSTISFDWSNLGKQRKNDLIKFLEWWILKIFNNRQRAKNINNQTGTYKGSLELKLLLWILISKNFKFFKEWLRIECYLNFEKIVDLNS